MKYTTLCTLITIGTLFCYTAHSQTNAVHLKDGGNTLISSHNNITDAYAAIPATVTQPYVIEIDSNYNTLGEVFPITFTEKLGADATNTITVKLAPYVYFKGIYSSDSTKPIIVFDDADWMILDGVTGPSNLGINISYDNNIVDVKQPFISFVNGATHNHIEQISFFADQYDINLDAVLTFGTSANNNTGNSDNTITRCSFLENGYGILSLGTESHPNNNNKVLDCNFNYHTGIIVDEGTGSMLIEGNRINVNCGIDTSSPAGIILKKVADTITINKNVISVSIHQNASVNHIEGIQINNGSGSMGYAAITNNLISVGGPMRNTDSGYNYIPDSIGKISGILLNNSVDINTGIYHNTIQINGINNSGIGSAAIAKIGNASGSNITIKNNILQNKRVEQNANISHVALGITDNSGNLLLDYNIYESAMGHYTFYNGNTYNTIASYVAAIGNGQELHTNNLKVDYADGWYRLGHTMMNHPDMKGEGIAQVLQDYESDARSYPYRGADELVVNCSGTPPRSIAHKGNRFSKCSNDSAWVSLYYNQTYNANLGGHAYQWQSKPLGSTADFTDVPGKTSLRCELYVNTSTIFRIKDSCVDGSNPQYSQPDTAIITPYPEVDSIAATRQGLTYSFTAIGATDVVSYLWKFGDGDSSTLANPVHTYQEDKQHYVSLKTTNNCGHVYTYSSTQRATSVGNINVVQVLVYPNPAQDQLQVQVGDAATVELQLYNYMGVLMQGEYNRLGNIITINTAAIPSGSYILKVVTNAGVSTTPVSVMH